MLRRLMVFAVVVAVLAGCGKATPQVSSLPTPGAQESPLTPATQLSPLSTPVVETLPSGTTAPGMGVIEGKVDLPLGWRLQEIQIYAAPFVSTGDENTGFYVLEPSVHSHAKVLQSGEFRLINVEPGRYVLVVGPSPDDAVAIQEDGTPTVFTVAADKTLDIGEVSLR